MNRQERVVTPGLQLVDAALGAKIAVELRQPAVASEDLDQLLQHAVEVEAQVVAMTRQQKQFRAARWRPKETSDG